MTSDQLFGVLTEIRDHQRRQLENFENALRAQEESNRIQQKSRKMFAFLVYAPWIALLMAVAGFVVQQLVS